MVGIGLSRFHASKNDTVGVEVGGEKAGVGGRGVVEVALTS